MVAVDPFVSNATSNSSYFSRKKPLRRPNHKSRDDLKMVIEETGCLIQPDQDKAQRQSFKKTMLDVWIPFIL
jgi:hypothetical protein